MTYSIWQDINSKYILKWLLLHHSHCLFFLHISFQTQGDFRKTLNRLSITVKITFCFISCYSYIAYCCMVVKAWIALLMVLFTVWTHERRVKYIYWWLATGNPHTVGNSSVFVTYCVQDDRACWMEKFYISPVRHVHCNSADWNGTPRPKITKKGPCHLAYTVSVTRLMNYIQNIQFYINTGRQKTEILQIIKTFLGSLQCGISPEWLVPRMGQKLWILYFS